MDVATVNPAAQLLPAASHSPGTTWLAENRELIRTIKSIDASGLFGDGSELTFAMDRDTGRPVIRVINRQTQEVLWQAPPEYLLRVAEVLGQPDQLHG